MENGSLHFGLPEEEQAQPAAAPEPQEEAPAAATWPDREQQEAEAVLPEQFVLNLSEEALSEFGSETPDPATYPPQHTGRRKKRKKRKYVKERISPLRMVFKIVLSLVILSLAVSVALGGVWVMRDVMGFKDSDQLIEVSVDPDETVADVADKMEEAGVIDSALLFRAYVRYATEGVTINFGKYSLRPSMSYSDIIHTLESYADQSNVARRITITEGMTVEEIAQVMQDNAICSKEDFIDEVNNGEFKASFVDALEDTRSLRPYRLEGYLFPDTNDYYIGSDAHDAVSKMLVNFDKRFTSDMREKAEDMDCTVDEIVTLASIVQAEATPEEMANVAGVYWNRLKHPEMFPNMQSDPTTLYAEEVLKPLGVAQEILDGYNTYRCEGLPTGPINNPGLEAIEAVLNPTESNYYFFLSTKDGSKFYYAETYEEHMENIEKAGLDTSLG